MDSASDKNASVDSSRTRHGRFQAVMPSPVDVVGLGCFSIWQNAQLRFFYPSSAGTVISPLFAFNVSAIFLALVCFISYRRDSQRAFSPAWFIGVAVIGTIAGSLGGGLVARSVLPLEGIYAAAAFSGFSVAALSYAWAERMQQISSHRAFSTIIIASLLGSVAEFCGMQISALLIPWFLVASGFGTCLCFTKMALHTATERELIFRPKQGRDYLALAIGLVVLAGALGIVSGSTASVCTEDSMRALNSLVTEDSVLFALLCVIILAVRADRFDWMSLIRLMPSLMLIAVLMNIPFVGYSDIWLSLTLFGWNAVRLLVFLFIIEVARKRIVSLSLIYPVAWSLLMAGHACGIVISQAFLPASIGMFDFMSSVVLVAVLAACSSMFILSNKLVLGLMASSQLPAEHAGSMPDAAAPSDAKQSSPVPPTMPESARLASPAPQEDPLPFAARCHALAQSHHLSSREEEVMMLLARGNTRANIAKRLFISENTVRAHVKSIYAKLYIHSKQQLINLVDLPDNPH